MKRISLSIFAIILTMTSMAQTAMDAYSVSQYELRGTARFVSMAGAFGALGGDISTLRQNPAGIGVYRNSDANVTIDLNFQNSSTNALGKTEKISQTKFNCNNAGYVGAWKLDGALKNFNWGFSYNREKSFDRNFAGTFSSIDGSVSNFIADGMTSGLSVRDLSKSVIRRTPDYNGNAPWLSALAYGASIINPDKNGENLQGLWKHGETRGFGEYQVIEQGGVDEFCINFGGNVNNLVYWGLGLGIHQIDQRKYFYYGEALENANVNIDADENSIIGTMRTGDATIGFEHYNNVKGSGCDFKLGVILRPINELRLGVAFHTPTYYSLRSSYYTNASFAYYRNGQLTNPRHQFEDTNNGYYQDADFRQRTPWRFMASAAAVISTKAIVSLDYEYIGYNGMQYKSADGRQYSYDITRTNQINDYLKASQVIRLGAEIRVTPQFSVRAGYSYQTSPTNDRVLDNKKEVDASDVNLAYVFDKSFQNITAGVGYKLSNVYFDLAYVRAERKGEYHAFSPMQYNIGMLNSPMSKFTLADNHLVLTAGVRF